ncbi:MAG: hypothetical protein KJS74_08160 [Rhodospirillales bacterium]|nr:hypothetical protein [Rhodospirillales bacterium]
MDRYLAGYLDFTHRRPTQPPLPPGKHELALFDDRNPLLVVPPSIDPALPSKFVVLFHGGGGSAQKILPMLEAHAEEKGFLLLVPQSLFPTWDIVIGGNGPDRERLDTTLAYVADRFAIDPTHFAFAGHSDGGSYAMSLGLTNGQFVTHIIISSAGFMTVQIQEGAPRIFMSHGTKDEQIPIDRSGRKHSAMLKDAGYDITYVEYDGPHAYQKEVVEKAVAFFLSEA